MGSAFQRERDTEAFCCVVHGISLNLREMRAGSFQLDAGRLAYPAWLESVAPKQVVGAALHADVSVALLSSLRSSATCVSSGPDLSCSSVSASFLRQFGCSSVVAGMFT